MGNREDLLAGAKTCLREKGFARTTARDIAAAAGTSLASIGYHFGSTEALLSQALIEALEEWGDELRHASAAGTGPGGTAMDRFQWYWDRIIESFAANRLLWAATFEVSPLLEQRPELRQFFAEATQQGRLGAVSMLQQVDESAVDEKTARTVGSFYYALQVGVLAQWLVDPEHAPSSRDLAEGLQAIAASVLAANGPSNADQAGSALEADANAVAER